MLHPKKKFRRPNFFFSEIAKSCNFSVKNGDFLKFATPPEKIFMTPPPLIEFFMTPSNMKELAHLCYPAFLTRRPLIEITNNQDQQNERTSFQDFYWFEVVYIKV